MKNFFLDKAGLLFFFAAVSCQSPPRPLSPSDLSPGQLEAMNQALEHVRNRRFLPAAKICDKLAAALKGQRPEAMMLFNAGSNYRAAGQCALSVSRYRRLLDQSLKNSSFKARGLFEISFSYECLGDDQAGFLSLKAAENFKSHLPWELSRMALPARLGIAAARLGKESQAEEYRSLALAAVLRSRGVYSSEREIAENLSRVFYLMGKSHVMKESVKLEAFLRAFPHHQSYLLQSVFLEGGEWPRLAERNLSLALENLHYALSASKDRKKHKKAALSALKEGMAMARKEKSKKWKDFYQGQIKRISSLFSS